MDASEEFLQDEGGSRADGSVGVLPVIDSGNGDFDSKRQRRNSKSVVNYGNVQWAYGEGNVPLGSEEVPTTAKKFISSVESLLSNKCNIAYKDIQVSFARCPRGDFAESLYYLSVEMTISGDNGVKISPVDIPQNYVAEIASLLCGYDVALYITQAAPSFVLEDAAQGDQLEYLKFNVLVFDERRRRWLLERKTIAVVWPFK